MATDVLMPPLSQTGDSLVLVEWLKREGDAVTKGEPLFLVESDKATLEIEAPASGLLVRIDARAGDEVPVKARVALIAAAGEHVQHEESSPLAAPDGPARAGKPPAHTPAQGERIPLPPERAQRVAASPRARQLASAEGLSLHGVRATGPAGMIVERDVTAALRNRPRLTPVAARAAMALQVDVTTFAPSGERVRRADVEAAASPAGSAPAQPPQAPAPASAHTPTRTPRTLDATRRTIATRLQAMYQQSVPVTLTREVDATALVALRDSLLGAWPAETPRLSFTDLFVAIAARCLLRHPHLNGVFDGAQVADGPPVDMALAVDTPRGLVTPVLRAAEARDLPQLAHERARLVERALANRLAPGDLEGGSFTLSNLGPLAIDAFTPLLNPPQIAILGVGRLRPVPAIVDGLLITRTHLILSLTVDHRVVDGAPAARFLADVADLISAPERIWLHMGR
jgi:pyruvate dehydrogenase E2 component (dihydrolipoamide acetyltransferase)